MEMLWKIENEIIYSFKTFVPTALLANAFTDADNS